MHNLLLRYYLAKGGVDPDKDVQIRPVPPPDSIAQLVAGDIDAYLMPDPFNQRAVYEDAGFIPITCASPIIMAEPMGFYNKFGMDVKVVKMPSWGAVRDLSLIHISEPTRPY